MQNTKKTYQTPQMTIVICDKMMLLSDSDEHTNHGRENACAHGSHAWFCDWAAYKYCMLLTEFLHKSYTNLDVILNAIKDKSSLLKKAIFISSDLILIPTYDYSRQDMIELNNLLQRNL